MRYMIQASHTTEECLRALDEQFGKGPEILSKFSYGCKAGDHTGYAIVDAKNDMEARNLVPGFLVNKARIIPVDVFTPEVIKSFHVKAA